MLRVSDDLLAIMEIVTGRMPAVLPVTSGIMQPSTATDAPCVGVTGAQHARPRQGAPAS